LALISVSGSNTPFTANVAGPDPTGQLEVTVNTDESVDLGPDQPAEPITINVKNLNDFAVTLGASPVTLEVGASTEDIPAAPEEVSGTAGVTQAHAAEGGGSNRPPSFRVPGWPT
jgi:hypothetical protein